MRAFRPIWTQNATDVLYARDFLHVPCLCGDQPIPIKKSRLEPSIDRVRARTSPHHHETELIGRVGTKLSIQLLILAQMLGEL